MNPDDSQDLSIAQDEHDADSERFTLNDALPDRQDITDHPDGDIPPRDESLDSQFPEAPPERQTLLPPDRDRENAVDPERSFSEPSADAEQITTPMVLEAILFAADEPITPHKLSEIVGAGGVREIRNHIDQLNQKYAQMNCSFRIETLAGGYQMLTQSRFNVWLRQLVKVRDETKLSPAALETLAIVAYKQPVIRVDVEAVRGVGCGEMIRQLSEKGLVKIVGRAEILGRPLLYGTTRKFLEVFGLHSLQDLPQADSLKLPS